MAAPPLRTELSDTYPNPSNATARSGFGKLWDYATGLLGATGNPPEARVALGFPGISSADNGRVLAVNESGDTFRLLDLAQPSAWINSDFRNNPRALTSLADGTYGPDRTYALTQSGSVSYTTLTKPTDGIPFAGRFTQPDVTAKRFGFAQIMEAEATYAYCGQDFAFVPKVRCSSAAVIRVALLAHTGTADTLAKDVVNDWTSAVYTAGAFFAAGLTVVDVQSVACLANVWTDVPTWKSIPSSANNLIMFCWAENAVVQGFTLDASVIRAGRGQSASVWLPPDPSLEVVRASGMGPAFSAYASAATAMTSNVWGKISLQAEEFDTDACFDTATGRFQPNVPGYYSVMGSVRGTVMAAMSSAIYKNGTVHAQGVNIGTADQNSSAVSDLVYLNGTTDYIELWGWLSSTQNSSTEWYATYLRGFLARMAG